MGVDEKGNELEVYGVRSTNGTHLGSGEAQGLQEVDRVKSQWS